MEAPQRDSPSPAKFTERERQVLLLLWDGLTTKEIAKQLGIAFKTVTTHRQRILKKANVRRTTHLFRYAIKNGIIQA